MSQQSDSFHLIASWLPWHLLEKAETFGPVETWWRRRRGVLHADSGAFQLWQDGGGCSDTCASWRRLHLNSPGSDTLAGKLGARDRTVVTGPPGALWRRWNCRNCHFPMSGPCLTWQFSLWADHSSAASATAAPHHFWRPCGDEQRPQLVAHRPTRQRIWTGAEQLTGNDRSGRRSCSTEKSTGPDLSDWKLNQFPFDADQSLAGLTTVHSENGPSPTSLPLPYAWHLFWTIHVP